MKFTRRGPWDNEKDLYKFREPATGLRCFVVRMKSSGHLNGYVELPHKSKYAKASRKRGSKYIFRGARSISFMVKKEIHDRLHTINVHGGLTFSGRVRSRISKRPVVGFDCAHYRDLCPHYDWTDGVYRTFEYVRDECFFLAKQLAALHGSK